MFIRLNEENGQGVVEYLVATLLVFIILTSLTALSQWWKNDAPSSDSFVQKTYKLPPNTTYSSEGVNIYAPEDLFTH